MGLDLENLSALGTVHREPRKQLKETRVQENDVLITFSMF
jgi:hypothetical protein